MLEQRRKSVARFELILCDEQISSPSATAWEEAEPGGGLNRTIQLPGGKRMDECLREIGGYSDQEIKQFAEECPIVPEFEIVMLWR